MTTHNSASPSGAQIDNAFLAGRIGDPRDAADAELASSFDRFIKAEAEAERAHRAAVLTTWREHPDVAAFIAALRSANDYPAWDEFSAAVVANTYCRWSVRDEVTCLMLACAKQLGMAGMSDDDRAIIEERHAYSERNDVDPAARRWLLARDTKAVCPVTAASSWVAEYRAGLHEQLRELGMVVGLSPGAPPVLAVWTGVEQTPHVLREWLRGVGKESLEFAPEANVAEWVTLAPVRAERSLADLAFTPTESIGLLPSGLDDLDRLRGGIQRRGDRVIIQAATGNAKTALALTMAESLAARGFKVAWLATSDELAASIIARRLQRTGKYTYESAKEHVNDPAALALLNPNLMVIDGCRVVLEDVLAARPDFLFADNLQKMISRVGAGKGELEALNAALKLIEADGTTAVLTSRMVRGADKRGNRIEGSYGGVAIEGGATVLLDLRLTGDELDVTVLKGRGPGEHDSFRLTLDRAKQTLAPCPCHGTVAAPLSEAEANRREQILTVLAKGPKTARAIQTWVPGKYPDVKASLAELVAAGKVVLDGKEYAIKDPA